MILHTEVRGDGEPVVFLHTAFQTGVHDFEHVAFDLQADFKVILSDLRAHGKSVTEDVEDYYAKCADDLNETLEHLGVESAHIIGYSLGGMIGIFFAKQHHSRVRSLTFSGVMPEVPDNWDELSKAEADEITAVMNSRESAAQLDEIHGQGWRALAHFFLQPNWYPFEAIGDLRSIQAPMLFMVGESQPHETLGVQRYPAMNDGVRVAVIPFAGHHVQSEQPELYAKILRLFIKNIS
ncbi:alpha/beta fold hydrolase [Geomicrobium sp. JCM 19039]|uniref:alpha/beta fold hydrolase n=1 Tax=Geomicrobium sp. JCM 19039 TaxID=1460636 RepID=UPI00045F35A6|nr:alpha/beta fold hydrolase [Geomicrobium sp. JCM 19039]GAK14598.1 hydrolase [Geomicrobium sp. JCM 19039]